jgi:hypothetical protein
VRQHGAVVLCAAAVAFGAGAPVRAARLEPESVAGWRAYVAAAETRMARELSSRDRFLALDFDENAAADRRRLMEGELVIRRVEAVDSHGRPMLVRSAAVHHWRGSVYVPGARLDHMIRALQTEPPTWPQDVLKAAIVERAPHHMTVNLTMQRRKLVTVVYNTQHDVVFREYGPTRATSTSISTRIAELESPGAVNERERPPGDDRGFLWRLNAYWRYEQVPGGMLVECESICLSREIPAALRYLVGPLIESTARESMERTLTSLRGRFAVG